METRTFDYIVVGAGSAGAAVAYRLSESGKHSVLVLEAGRESHPWSRIPVGFAKLIHNPAANWLLFSAEPDGGTGRRRISRSRAASCSAGPVRSTAWSSPAARRRISTIWAQLGNRGWSYQDVLPIFKQMESYDGGSDEFRGRDGLLKVTDSGKLSPLFDKMIQAAEKIGIPYNADYNGASQEGIAMSQATINKGRRQSTAYCYLDPARDRENLTIETGALGGSLILDGKRCTGVRYTVGGEAREAHATREVILSGGSINSPKILELSGIGQPELLRQHGIEVQHELRGSARTCATIIHRACAGRCRHHSALTYNDKARGLGLV